MLRFLRDHARRELRILELEGPIHPGEITVSDLVDEVLSLAWERFADRPRHLPLDLWLVDLLHEVVAQWMRQNRDPRLAREEVNETLPAEVPQWTTRSGGPGFWATRILWPWRT